MITEIYAHAARHSRIPEVRDCTADGKPVLAVSDGDSIKNEWQHATQSDAEPDGFSYLSFQGVPRTLTRVTRDSPSRLPQGLAGPPQRALRHLLALSGLFTWVHEDKIEKATSIAEGVGLFVTLKNNDLFLVQSPANPLGDSVCYDFHRSKWRNVAQIRPWSEALYTPKPRGMLTVAEANSEMHRIYEHQRKILQLRLTESLNSANSFAWSASAHSPTQFAAWQDAQLGPQTYAPALSYAGASESSAASGDNDQVRQAHTSAGDSMQAVARDFGSFQDTSDAAHVGPNSSSAQAVLAYGANNLLIGSVGFNGMAGNCASRSLRWLFEHGRSKSFHSAALCLPKGIHHNFDGDVIDGGFEPPTAPKLQRVHHVTPCEHIVSVTAVREAFQPRQPAR